MLPGSLSGLRTLCLSMYNRAEGPLAVVCYLRQSKLLYISPSLFPSRLFPSLAACVALFQASRVFNLAVCGAFQMASTWPCQFLQCLRPPWIALTGSYRAAIDLLLRPSLCFWVVDRFAWFQLFPSASFSPSSSPSNKPGHGWVSVCLVRTCTLVVSMRGRDSDKDCVDLIIKVCSKLYITRRWLGSSRQQ